MKRRKSRTNVKVSSGRPKKKSLESVDRISILPDPILGVILSFLPTKNAVSTSLLSKRWKLVWTTVHNLDFCYEDREAKQDERDDMRFVGFVNRVLLHHDAGRLNKFSLVWTPRCISSHATSWISTAISKNVHELSLRLETHTVCVSKYSVDKEDPEPYVMPICLFSCNTLRFLELDGGISVSAAIVVCLPALETIKLDSVFFESEEAFEKLIRGCPVLINLFISISADILFKFRQDDDFKYIISSTSLRRLEILNEYETFKYPSYINLQIEASSLEYLALVGVELIPIFYVENCLSSLVEAKFDVYLQEWTLSDADICNLVVQAFRELNCAKALTLTSSIIRALNCATISPSIEFKRLVKLEAETICWTCRLLRDLIQCSDNLEVLTIAQYPKDDEDENDDEDEEDDEDENDDEDEDDDEDENNDEDDEDGHVDEDENNDEDEYVDDHSNWTTMIEVPRCLSTSLKKVVLQGYNGNEDEHEMICYLLKHGSALEVMEIYIMLEDDKLDLIQKIREFPRKSPACVLKIFRPRPCNHPSHVVWHYLGVGKYASCVFELDS